MSRVSQIKQIIEKRQPLVKKIEAAEAGLQALSTQLQALEKYRSNLFSQIDNTNVISSLQSINLMRLQEEVTKELSALVKLRNRFARKTINIGVVGRARQGKSRLLQTLSGLSSSEIPTGDGYHCTGVRSTITHIPETKTYGEVFFHSEQSFLNQVISPYYIKLNLGSSPLSLQEFAEKPLPELSGQHKQTAVSQAMYEHLRKYYNHFPDYKHWFKESSPYRISQEKIREFVAQDTLSGERIYFSYLAVQEVKVCCSFPNDDIGQVSLIDMPGLGDTGLGDAERMVKILGQDVDSVLFVRRPNDLGDFWSDADVQLYDLAKSSLTELPINLWSFIVLNHVRNPSDNIKGCENFKQDLGNKHLDVVEAITADCANAEEAGQQILGRILDYLTSNIASLDEQYAQACQSRLTNLQTFINAEMAKADKALGMALVSTSEGSKFTGLLNKFWTDINKKIELLLNDLENKSQGEEPVFRKAVESILEDCKKNSPIPSIEKIEDRCIDNEGFLAVYQFYVNEIRAELSRRFLPLDESLENYLTAVKSSVAEALQSTALGNLAKNGIKYQNYEFLVFIENLIPESDEVLSSLRYGFNVLSSFKLSYRGLIQHRIRRELGSLTVKNSDVISFPDGSASVQDTLSENYREALYHCRNALEKIYSEPNEAAFAIVEEFKDRVFRANDETAGSTDIRATESKDKWRDFLEPLKADVWTNDFEKLAENSRLRTEWTALIKKVSSSSQMLVFLK